jgi:hypothetical protein
MRPKKRTPYVFEHGEAVQYMNPGEARALLSPLDRSVLIALDGRMSPQEIAQRTGISDIAFVISCQRLLILGLIEEREPKKLRGMHARLGRRVDGRPAARSLRARLRELEAK